MLIRAEKKWLEFSTPGRVIATNRIVEVLPLVRQVEALVEQEGWHAAGFVSYEAAPAFDPSLPAKPDGAFPLLWFGLFEHAREIDLPGAGQAQPPALAWRPTVARDEYERCLNAIRGRIRDGDTYQVNYTYRLRAQTDADPWRLFLQIAGDGEAPFAAYVDTGEWAVCSASPELFLKVNGEQIESRPMKGTAARGLWFEDDQAQKKALISSAKDRAENIMIVDMVRNDLGRVAHAGSVQVAALCAAEQYPSVWQLTSTVTARTGASLDRILQATFPPASITGAPKRRTMEIIAELESTPRRIYTGAIGYIAPGRRIQFNVAIRTVLVHKPTGCAEYGVGGGVVWDSTPAGEYNESLAKAKVLRPLPRDFDLLETILWSPGGGYALLEYHLRRLARSAAYFGFQFETLRARQALAAAAAGLLPAQYRVRLCLSRLGGIRCEAALLDAAALRFGDVALARNPIDKRDVFFYHKTTRRAAYDAAVQHCPGYADVLLFNEEGEVTETTLANVAVEIDGVRYTPPVRCGLLPGTQRALLLQQGLLRERPISIAEALGSPSVCLLNSVRGIQPVRLHVDGERAAATPP